MPYRCAIFPAPTFLSLWKCLVLLRDLVYGYWYFNSCNNYFYLMIGCLMNSINYQYKMTCSFFIVKIRFLKNPLSWLSPLVKYVLRSAPVLHFLLNENMPSNPPLNIILNIELVFLFYANKIFNLYRMIFMNVSKWDESNISTVDTACM